MEHSAANSCKNPTQISWSITYMDKEIFEKNSLYFQWAYISCEPACEASSVTTCVHGTGKFWLILAHSEPVVELKMVLWDQKMPWRFKCTYQKVLVQQYAE